MSSDLPLVALRESAQFVVTVALGYQPELVSLAPVLEAGVSSVELGPLPARTPAQRLRLRHRLVIRLTGPAALHELRPAVDDPYAATDFAAALQLAAALASRSRDLVAAAETVAVYYSRARRLVRYARPEVLGFAQTLLDYGVLVGPALRAEATEVYVSLRLGRPRRRPPKKMHKIKPISFLRN
jgi:hypothetical protein